MMLSPSAKSESVTTRLRGSRRVWVTSPSRMK
jgi:hypothetical protein